MMWVRTCPSVANSWSTPRGCNRVTRCHMTVNTSENIQLQRNTTGTGRFRVARSPGGGTHGIVFSARLRLFLVFFSELCFGHRAWTVPRTLAFEIEHLKKYLFLSFFLAFSLSLSLFLSLLLSSSLLLSLALSCSFFSFSFSVLRSADLFVRPHVCDHTHRDVLLSDTLSFFAHLERTEQHVVTTNDMLIRTCIRETNSTLLSLFLSFTLYSLSLSLCLSFSLFLTLSLSLSLCLCVCLSLSFTFVSCSLLRVFLLFLPLAVCHVFFLSVFPRRLPGSPRRSVMTCSSSVAHRGRCLASLAACRPCFVLLSIVSSRPLA